MKKILLYGLLGFLALNVFLFVWFAARTSPEPVPSPAPENSPDIALLKERSALKFDVDPAKKATAPIEEKTQQETAAEAKPDMAAEAKPALKIMRCYVIGPFKKRSQSNKLSEGLKALEMKVASRTELPKKLIGYWVYLPPQGGKAAARLKMQEMQNKGVKDIAIVFKQQPRYAISLGLFRQKSIAEERLQEIQALGYPALLEERHQDKQTIWLDIELEDSRKLEEARWQKMLSKYPGVKLEEKVCK